MFELGDDLPTLGAEPERVKLIENQDLLDMVRLQRSSKPLDLMTYSPEDEQPSIFVLQEDRRQAVLVVFNWTDGARSHQFRMSDLGLPSEHTYNCPTSFAGIVRCPLTTESIANLKPTSPFCAAAENRGYIRAAAAPSISLKVPEQAQLGRAVELSASC